MYVCIHAVPTCVYACTEVHTHVYICMHTNVHKYVHKVCLIFQHLLLYIYTQVVEWLLKYTNRLPSDAECQKCLLAPAPDDLDEATRSDLLHNRTKCLELIMKVCVCVCVCTCV